MGGEKTSQQKGNQRMNGFFDSEETDYKPGNLPRERALRRDFPKDITGIPRKTPYNP